MHANHASHSDPLLCFHMAGTLLMLYERTVLPAQFTQAKQQERDLLQTRSGIAVHSALGTEYGLRKTKN